MSRQKISATGSGENYQIAAGGDVSVGQHSAAGDDVAVDFSSSCAGLLSVQGLSK
jgi:hypothetical protein